MLNFRKISVFLYSKLKMNRRADNDATTEKMALRARAVPAIWLQRNKICPRRPISAR
jgi:hypothetical protein